MSRRKKTTGHVSHERWLVSYADFITLMFAFFVVLYSSSQVDKRKVGQLAMAIQVAFQELGIFEVSSARPPLDRSEPMPFSSVQVIENFDRSTAMDQLAPPPKDLLGREERNRIDELQKELTKALGPEITRGEVALIPEPEGLIISLREIGFFDPGSAALRPKSQPALKRIVAALVNRPFRLRIEGHTDNVPIHTARFESNWELSTARSTEMIKLFITEFGFHPARLSAAGYGEFHPIASNASSEDRQRNRRVDIVVLEPAKPSNQDARGAQPATRGVAAFPRETKPGM